MKIRIVSALYVFQGGAHPSQLVQVRAATPTATVGWVYARMVPTPQVHGRNVAPAEKANKSTALKPMTSQSQPPPTSAQVRAQDRGARGIQQQTVIICARAMSAF